MNNVKHLYALIFAFASVYIIWGSTYLAIRFAIESIPPWTLTGVRFLIAGLILRILSQFRRESALSPKELRVAITSGLLMTTANGVVCVAEQWVPSGIAAVIIGAMPIWIMIVGWGAFGVARPGIQKVLGALLGMAGVGLIAAKDVGLTESSFQLHGVGLLMLSSCLWSFGTLLQRGKLQDGRMFRFSAVQSLIGSAAPILLSFIFEKPWSLSFDQITTSSLIAQIYLIIFGSIVAFTAYSWLARNVESHILSTYALVNPLIALFLGWLFLNEAVDTRVMLATLLVLLGLALLILKRGKPTPQG